MKYLSGLAKKDLSSEIVLLRVVFDIKNEDLEECEKNGDLPLRVKAISPTIKFLRKRGARILILSHRGRPKLTNNSRLTTNDTKEFSLRPFADILSRELKEKVVFLKLDSGISTSSFFKETGCQVKNAKTNQIFLLENLRFFKGEKENDLKFAKMLSSMGTIYVNDAFGVDHRKNASVVAITKFLPSYAGLLLEDEIKNLSTVMKNPKRPLVVILGGAKVSGKIGMIQNLYKQTDYFLTAGGIANSIFAFLGFPVGDSLFEKIKLSGEIKAELNLSGDDDFKKKILLPIDSVIEDKKILDIGERTARKYGEVVKKAKTIIWNGPLGLIEEKKFRVGSEAIRDAIFKSSAFAVIGGGETETLFNKTRENIFLSTGGGAMLEFLAGKKLSGIEALKRPTTND